MKKFFSLVLAMLMCVCLMAGCGQAEDPVEEPSEAPASGEPAAEEPSGEEEPAVEGAAFKFGGVGPLTGDNAIYGTAVMNGAQIAVDEINAAGGINGYQIDFDFQDDVSDGETSVNAYNNLMDNDMQVLVGPVTTGPAISVSSVAYEDRVFTLTPSASSPDVVAGKDNVFQLCFTDPNQGMGSATYMAANMPDSKIAVIYRNDDAYSRASATRSLPSARTRAWRSSTRAPSPMRPPRISPSSWPAPSLPGPTSCSCPSTTRPASVILAQADAMGYEPIPSSAWTAWTASSPSRTST